LAAARAGGVAGRAEVDHDLRGADDDAGEDGEDEKLFSVLAFAGGNCRRLGWVARRSAPAIASGRVGRLNRTQSRDQQKTGKESAEHCTPQSLSSYVSLYLFRSVGALISRHFSVRSCRGKYMPQAPDFSTRKAIHPLWGSVN
jgi:hypothetical protein